MNFEKLRIENKDGQKLGARLDLPVDESPLAYALFAHCFTCTKNLEAVDNISQALTQQRIAVLRFDFTGLGESEGDFADTNFSSNIDDLVAAADYLKEQYTAPQILIGHSLGGAAVLQAAARIPSAVAVATIAAPSQPKHILQLLGSDKETIEEQGVAEVTMADQTFTIKKQFLDDLAETRMQESIRSLRRALLILHSPLDNIVGVENAADIFQAAKHSKSFISLDTADHLLTDEQDSRYVGSVTAAWAMKYLKRAGDALKEVSVAGAGNQVTVRTNRQKYRTEVIAGGHGLIADEPQKYGGQDLGPNPYDYLLTALGACSSMTVRMYADRKEWPLESVVIRLDHRKIHAQDCADCETEKGKIDQIAREVELIGDLDEEQRQRLLEIADRCPVHRTLHAEVKIRSSLKEQ